MGVSKERPRVAMTTAGLRSTRSALIIDLVVSVVFQFGGDAEQEKRWPVDCRDIQVARMSGTASDGFVKEQTP